MTSSPYDGFAQLYDEFWAAGALGWETDSLDLLLPPIGRDQRLLDVCCGTGRLAQVLAERGFDVTAFDISEGMVSLARANAPDVRILRGDVRRVTFGRKFNIITCMHDSLNHLESVQDLRDALGSLASALTENGTLIFDLNFDEAFARWDSTRTYVASDRVWSAIGSFDPHDRRAGLQVVAFSRERGAWCRLDVMLWETYFEESEVLEALRSVGLRKVETFERSELLGHGRKGKVLYRAQHNA